MMSRPANYVRPIQLSLSVLRDAGIDSFPVSLKQILRHYGVRLMCYEDYCRCNECSIQTCFDLFGKDGATIENNGRYLIVYNKNQAVKDRIRFTLAHELGHIFHRHHQELGVEILQRLWVEKSLYDVMEDEANCFARNLLCPALSVQTVLRSHGFVFAEYDEGQRRNVWWKVSNAPCLPNLPPNLTDYFLIQQSFKVTAAAAKIRCSFLKEDLRNTSLEGADRILRKMSFTTQWRCRKCGALRLPDQEYCYHCGSKNRYGFVSADEPSPRPVMLRYNGSRYSSCPACGNDYLPADYNYCTICGAPAANPCIPGRVRNHSIEHLLDLAESGSVHLNPPGSRYCLTCGAPTLYRDHGTAIRLYEYMKRIGYATVETNDQGGLPSVKYGPNIPSGMSNGEYKVQKCPKCLNEDIEYDAEYCIMCGTSLTNVCDGIESDYDGELIRHSNPANARFCHRCGKPTAYSRLPILPSYQVQLKIQAKRDALRRELAEMDIDEGTFWSMNGMDEPDLDSGDFVNDGDEGEADAAEDAVASVPGQRNVFEYVDTEDDGELPF